MKVPILTHKQFLVLRMINSGATQYDIMKDLQQYYVTKIRDITLSLIIRRLKKMELVYLDKEYKITELGKKELEEFLEFYSQFFPLENGS